MRLQVCNLFLFMIVEADYEKIVRDNNYNMFNIWQFDR